jgi:hypothetical protein
MPETAHINSEDLRKKSDSINIRNGSNSRDDNNVRDIHEEQRQECHSGTAKTPATAGMSEKLTSARAGMTSTVRTSEIEVTTLILGMAAIAGTITTSGISTKSNSRNAIQEQKKHQQQQKCQKWLTSATAGMTSSW